MVVSERFDSFLVFSNDHNFTNSENTNKLLNVLDIYTDDFHDFIQYKQ